VISGNSDVIGDYEEVNQGLAFRTNEALLQGTDRLNISSLDAGTSKSSLVTASSKDSACSTWLPGTTQCLG
jgi:hypothetical protein